VLNRGRIARVLDAARQPLSDAEAALDLRQQQNTTIRGQPTAIKSKLHGLATDRWKTKQNPITLDHGGCELHETVVMLLRHQNHIRFQCDVRTRQPHSGSTVNLPG
jgi:hypothetical protein